jgi:hypothetical protein
VSVTAVSSVKEWFTNSIGELMRAALNLLVADNDYHHLNYALQSVGVAIGTTTTRARVHGCGRRDGRRRVLRVEGGDRR